jgi:RNA polymerase sigma factor (sigma-70 family)
MNGIQLRAMIGRLWRAVRDEEGGGLGDAELLRRWANDRDEAAFEVLLWRHGPMVLGLCRRMLRNAQDVEDAFQSTFLALAQKAGSIGKGEAVGTWLFTVARRVALQARARSARQPAQDPALLELVAAPGPEGTAEANLREVLEEEVGRLPPKYRAAFVLCQLEGRTNEEAARELGCPVGTLVSRLARARQRLRARLTRRGLAGAAVAALLAEGSAAALPAALVRSTVQAAAACAARTAGVLSPSVTALAQGVLREIGVMKMKKAAMFVLAAALLVVGGSFLTYQRALARARAEEEAARARAGAARGERPRGLWPRREREAPPAEQAEAKEAGRPAAPAASTGASERRARLEDAREEVELLEAQLEVKRAQVAAAKVVLDAAGLRLARLNQLHRSAAASAEEVTKATFDQQAAKAQLAVREAEVREPAVRLKHARRRLKALEDAARPAPTPRALKGQLRELEKKLDALRKEVGALRKELRKDKGDEP